MEKASGTSRRYQTGKHLGDFLLLLVAERADHGGALLERLGAILPRGWTIDTGQVYRLLRTLEDDGMLRSTWQVMPEGAPVRVYAITAAGGEHLRAAAEEIVQRREALGRFLAIWRHLGRGVGGVRGPDDPA